MPTRGSKDTNGRALRGRRAHTTFISDPIAQLWSNYNVRSGATGAIAPEQPAVQNCLYDRFEALYKKSSIKPSLLIVPARFQGGTLYSQIPTSGAGDFTVTRATAATRVNASGYIESVASGIPRLDYFASGGTVGCPALLVEPSGTNLSLNSNSFSVETAPVATVVQNQVDIFGNPNSAWLMSGADSSTDAANANNVRKITSGFTSGSTYAGSIYIKSPTGAPVTFRYRQATITTSTVASGDGWFRAVNVSTLSSTSYRAIFYTDDGAPIIMCHSQAELGTVPTSYIPTTTAAVTRNADVILVSGAVSGSIGQTQGTIYAEVDVRNFTVNSRLISISNGTQSNRITTLFFGTNVIRLLATVGGLGQVAINSSSLSAGIIKFAIGYALNDYAFYVNGVQVGTSSSALVPACNAVILGSVDSLTGSSVMNDRIRAVALYTTRLTNAELQFLTS